MISYLDVLNDSTFWVAFSFILFMFLVYKPIKNMILVNLDKKIDELKSQLNESKKLKEDAQNLYQEYLQKQKENLKKIENLKVDAQNQSIIIKEKIKNDIDSAFKRKKMNYEQLSTQMEIKIRQNITNEILRKTLLYTEIRLKENLKKNHNTQLIDESLKKLTSHLS
tara:strand:+ start:164 stop:664 length:501 start_codon:yes stop_codon:yes gene_type:complete